MGGVLNVDSIYIKSHSPLLLLHHYAFQLNQSKIRPISFMSSSSSSIPTAADNVRGARITAIHPAIIQSNILNRLDSRSLAIASCASVQFLSLCNDDAIWKGICNSTWPSTADPRVAAAISAFSSGHHSFYSDASPALCQFPPRSTHVPAASELISAVDIFYGDKLIHSNVVVTDTRSLAGDFLIDISDLKELAAVPLNQQDSLCIERAQEHLRLSWILIDPANRRAINMASRKAVDSRRHCLNADIQLRYASVLPMSGGGGGCDEKSVMCCMFVDCTWKEDGGLRVVDTYLNMKGSDGTNLTGIEGLKALEEAFEGKRWRSKERYIYEEFCDMNREKREMKLNKNSKWEWNFGGFMVHCICISCISGVYFSEGVVRKITSHARRCSAFIKSWVG